jgi:hypothetical protein
MTQLKDLTEGSHFIVPTLGRGLVWYKGAFIPLHGNDECSMVFYCMQRDHMTQNAAFMPDCEVEEVNRR